MSNVDLWIEKCRLAAAGKLDRGEAEELSNQIYGAFYQNKGYGRIGYNASNKRWNETLGGLLVYQDQMAHEIEIARASASSVSNMASAANDVAVSVSVSAAMSAAFEQAGSLGLSEEDENKVKAMLADLQNEMDGEKRSEKFAKAVAWAAENAPKLVEAIMKVGGALSQMPPLPM